MGTSDNEQHGDADALQVAVQVRAERLTSLQARVAMPACIGALFSLLPVALLWQHLPELDLLGWLCGRLPRGRVVLPNLYIIGVQSVPVVLVTGCFIGMRGRNARQAENETLAG